MPFLGLSWIPEESFCVLEKEHTYLHRKQHKKGPRMTQPSAEKTPGQKTSPDRAAMSLGRIFAVLTPASLPVCAGVIYFGGPIAGLGLIVVATILGISIGVILALLIEILRRL